MSAPTAAEKLQAALDFLGSHYVLHPSRHVPRGVYEQPVQRTNLTETFARVRRRFVGSVEGK